MCLIENSNITYGITLSSRPGHDVSVYYQLEKKYIDSPLQFQIFPDQPILFQPDEWETTKPFTVFVKYDDIDNHQDIDAIVIRHWVITEDNVFKENALNVSASFRITDDDSAGIELSDDSTSLVVSGGETRIITIKAFLSKPMHKVTLKVVNIDGIPGIENIRVDPPEIIVLPNDWQKETTFTFEVLDNIASDISFKMIVQSESIDFKYNGAINDKVVNVFIPPAILLPPPVPRNIALKRVNATIMAVSWDAVNDVLEDSVGSSYTLFYDIKYGIRKQLDNSTGEFFRQWNSIQSNSYQGLVEVPLYKKVFTLWYAHGGLN